MNLHEWVGLQASSTKLAQQLKVLFASTTAQNGREPDVKAYSDVVYYNYYDLGLSLVFSPTEPYKTKTGQPREELNEHLLQLSSVDVYNHEASLEPPASSLRSKSETTKAKRGQPKYRPFPTYPLHFDFTSETNERIMLDVTPSSVGKDFVEVLGEPDRKGGGEGSLGIWTEWTQYGLMVEFASAGALAWDKGGQSTWRTLTVFEPSSTASTAPLA